MGFIVLACPCKIISPYSLHSWLHLLSSFAAVTIVLDYMYFKWGENCNSENPALVWEEGERKKKEEVTFECKIYERVQMNANMRGFAIQM